MNLKSTVIDVFIDSLWYEKSCMHGTKPHLYQEPLLGTSSDIVSA
jgi:hypothetical protein